MPSNPSQKPVSFPVSSDYTLMRRRAVFSRSIHGLDSHHADSSQPQGDSARAKRRKIDDDSLRLIDDLTNRPVDPLFSDARLTQRPHSAFSTWSIRIVVFIICIGVGFAGSLFVQQLHTDPRKEVRASLAQELVQQNKQVDSLTKETTQLRGSVDRESKKLSSVGTDSTFVHDEMSSGLLSVTGPGIVLTLADPLSATSDSGSGSLPRETGGTHIRVITDSDLQMLLSLLWQSGAEAISINGHRIGVQTSVRTAGQTILVGVNQIQSPYSFEVIGDSSSLAQDVGSGTQKSLYESFRSAGIFPQVRKATSLTLEAAGSGDVTYAKRSD